MNFDSFRTWSRRIADWGANYRERVADFPVRAQTKPGDIARQIPDHPPEAAENMDNIFADFERIIMPGISHWQHPKFFAYFPSNAAPPSVLADYLVSAMSVNCLIWQASPAGTELETRTMDWLRQAVGLSDQFEGVIQDSASGATLVAVLTMRERALSWSGNKQGLSQAKPLRIYCSEQVHSSIDRAIWIAGIGDDNLVRIKTQGPNHAMDVEVLEQQIISDIEQGFQPVGLIGCIGGTSIGASDNLVDLTAIAQKYGLYVHVDAAWAGAAMICPELRDLWRGIEQVDSLVFNPHKWLGVSFDCSAHFLKSPEDTVRTLAAKPEYLKTRHADDRAARSAINYSEWSVPLGRRFRALKIWFLLRAYGLEALRERIRHHIAWSQDLAQAIEKLDNFEITSQPQLSLFSFRLNPKDLNLSAEQTNQLNQRLIEAINDDGRIYLTQTLHKGQFVIRFQAGQFDCTREDVMSTLDVLQDLSSKIDLTEV